MANELMSSIRFWTTPKGDMPQYSFILSNQDPLVAVLNNYACPRLGNMLYLDIQEVEKLMNTL